MKKHAILTACGAVLLLGAAASAQHADDYETGYSADAAGVIITGQPAGPNPFYIPVADSNDGLVFTYAGNALGIPANPAGGQNFVGTSEGDPADPDLQPFIRSQRDVQFPQNGIIKSAYDVLATKLGDTSSSDNIGSWSTQLVPGGNTLGYIDLFAWVDPADTTLGFNGSEVWFDAAGTQLIEVIPEFAGLPLDKWYRRYSFYDPETNLIVKLVIVDPVTGERLVNKTPDRYATGGAVPGQVPTGFRYFAGCSGTTCTAGNTVAWDNLVITCTEDINEDLDIGFADLLTVLAQWGTDDVFADLDNDQNVGFSDLLLILAKWGPCS